MAPHVKKAKTAFLYYQADQLSKIRQQLGPAASMGEAMTEVRNVTICMLNKKYCTSLHRLRLAKLAKQAKVAAKQSKLAAKQASSKAS
jgi:hypothetical protein